VFAAALVEEDEVELFEGAGDEGAGGVAEGDPQSLVGVRVVELEPVDGGLTGTCEGRE
jgi:hypothetical protein